MSTDMVASFPAALRPINHRHGPAVTAPNPETPFPGSTPQSAAARRAARVAASWSGERSPSAQAAERRPRLPATVTCWAALRRALAAFRRRRRVCFARPPGVARPIRLRLWSMSRVTELGICWPAQGPIRKPASGKAQTMAAKPLAGSWRHPVAVQVSTVHGSPSSQPLEVPTTHGGPLGSVVVVAGGGGARLVVVLDDVVVEEDVAAVVLVTLVVVVVVLAVEVVVASVVLVVVGTFTVDDVVVEEGVDVLVVELLLVLVELLVLAVALVELLIEVDDVDEVVLVVAAVLLVVELDDVLVVVVDTVVVVEQPGTGACWQPLAGSQVSVVQTFPSSQLTGPPTHRSAKQASAVVQALPSSHGVPSVTTVCVQTPA